MAHPKANEFRPLSKIKSELTRIGWTQGKLALISDIPRPLISMGLSGRYMFDIHQKRAIAAALDLRMSELFGAVYDE